MALPALPLLFILGSTVVRAATPRIASYLTKQGFKRAVGQAAKKPVSSVVTSVKQAQKLKPATKVVNKKPPATKVVNKKPTASMQQKTTAKPSSSGGLRPDPKDRITTPLKRKPKSKPNALGTPGQRALVSAGVTAASLASVLPNKKSKKDTPTKSNAKNRSQEKKDAYEAIIKAGQESRAKKAKSWRDYKSVSAAQKDGFDYFTGRDGKKKIAVTQEQLKKSGKSLREYANTIRNKKRK